VKLSTLIFGLWLALLTVAVLRSIGGSDSRPAYAAEPVRKPTLSLALDDAAPSRMLRSELSRDWLQPNAAVVLTRRQRSDLAVIGHSMNAIQRQILLEFRIVYVEADAVPLPQRLHLPAIRINRGRWESIDRRAFAFETRPLLTLDWYRTRYLALFDRDAALDSLAEYGCAEEGYSGAGQIETPAPWEMTREMTREMKPTQAE
jgi:hypothetical protein